MKAWNLINKYRSFIFGFILFFTHLIALANTNKCHNALYNHIKEAISHNKKMIHPYSKITNGKSIKWSYAIIALEEFGLFTAKSLDHQAQLYHRFNIPVLCEELITMKNLPPYTGAWPLEKRPDTLTVIDIKSINQILKKYFAEKNYEEAYRFLDKILSELEANPRQLCLTKHFLESMARTIWLMDNHISMALDQKLESPEKLISHFLGIQRKSLMMAHLLDTKIFSMQKEKGLPLYCDDVPKIIWK